MSDDRTLVHITAPPGRHDRLEKDLERAHDQGLFEGYEFLVTGPEVTAVDVDALATELAPRLLKEVRDINP